jgi:geranylgeranyl pyrophosphate synthase
MHSSNQEVRDEAIAIMDRYGSMDYVKKTANRMVKESWEEAEKCLTNREGKEKLKAFAEFLIERNI